MKRIRLILLELHLALLKAKAAVVATTTATYHAVRSNHVVVAAVTKVQGLRHLVTLEVRPVLARGLVKARAMTGHTKVVGVSLLTLLVLIGFCKLVDRSVKLQDAHAKALTVQAIKETIPAAPAAPAAASGLPSLNGVTRVSELDPEGHTVLAATVPTGSITIDASGLTWHPIAGFTEHWTGSYRLAP